MKFIKLSCVVLLAIIGLSACSSSKKVASDTAVIERIYRDLRTSLPGAEVTYTRKGGIKVVYPEVAMFDFGKDVIKQSAYPSFKHFADVLRDYPRLDIVIRGYTDNIGSDEVNLDLSRRRAMSGKNILVQNGIGAGRIETRGFGSKRPFLSNATEEGRQANRRVEFLIYD